MPDGIKAVEFPKYIKKVCYKMNQYKETDKVKVELQNLRTANRNRVIISKGSKSVFLYFSYDTLIAVDGVVSENVFSMTTGKFLNELEPNKKKRVPHEKVLQEADKRIRDVLYDH